MTVGRTPSGPSVNDGVLEVHEILELTTNSPLVFLSGCETGLVSAAEGQMVAGADETSLSHALLLAGARSVVATLWRVDDLAAARIAGTFYLHLRQGVPADAALALAQRTALRESRDYTWAAYAVSGAPGR
jgi:CHAT domain-containing protein